MTESKTQAEIIAEQVAAAVKTEVPNCIWNRLISVIPIGQKPAWKSIFRYCAATKAPKDPAEAAKIMPFYACESPNGEKGIWTKISTNEVMGDDFDPILLTPEQRKEYSYEGPEVIYIFWAKHGPCAAPGRGHRTPQCLVRW